MCEKVDVAGTSDSFPGRGQRLAHQLRGCSRWTVTSFPHVSMPVKRPADGEATEPATNHDLQVSSTGVELAALDDGIDKRCRFGWLFQPAALVD